MTSFSTATFQGSVTPVPGERIDRLPEGIRSKDQALVITSFDLRGASDDDDHPADRVQIDSKTFEVYKVVEYTEVIPHIEAHVIRLDR